MSGGGFRTYRIGVHLAMTQNVTAALGVIAGQMMGLQRHINGARVGFNALGAAVAGMGMAMAGGAMIRGATAMLDAGRELIHQKALLRAAGESDIDIARATQRAWEVAYSGIGTRVGDNLKLVGELRGLFGSMPEAEQVLPQFARFQRVLSTVTGESDEKAGGTMARMLDIVGAVQFNNGQLNVERFNQFMNQAQAATIQNRGRVGPHQLLGFVQQAGTAANVMNPQQLFADMSVLIESMGGHRAGTGIAAMQRQFLNGIMTERTFDTLNMLGMVTGPQGRITPTQRREAAAAMSREMEGGAQISPASLVRVAPRGIRGADRLAQGDYAGFVLQELVPQIQRFLRQSGQEVNDRNILAMLSRSGGTGPGQRTAAQLYLSRQQIERERNMQARIAADPVAAIRRLQETDPTFALARLSDAFHNLKTAIGEPGWERMLGPINLLSSGLEYLGGVMQRHPAMGRWLTTIGIGLGATLVVLGGVAIAGAAIAAMGGGAVAGTIVAIGVGLTALYLAITEINWTIAWRDIQDSFGQAWAWLQTLPGQLWGGIRAYAAGVWGRASADISDTFGQIQAAFMATIEGWRASIASAWQGFADASARGQATLTGFRDAILAPVLGWHSAFTESAERGRQALAGFRDWLLSPLQGWHTEFASAAERGRQALAGFRDAVVSAVLNFFRSLPGQFMEGLRNLPGAFGFGGAPAVPGAAPAPGEGTPAVRPSIFVPSPSMQGGVREASVYLDGARVGRVLSPHFGRAAAAPGGGPGRADWRRGGITPSVVGA